MVRVLDLVEDSAVGEMRRLRLLPAAERADVDQVELGETRQIFLGGEFGMGRSEIILGEKVATLSGSMFGYRGEEIITKAAPASMACRMRRGPGAR